MADSDVLDLVPQLQDQLGEIPWWLALGWIRVESAGQLSSSGLASLDERGYFQNSRDETRAVGASDADHAALSTDSDTSLYWGLAVVRDYEAKVRALGIASGELLWYLVKFFHGIGSGAARQVVQRYIGDNGGPPTEVDAFREYASSLGTISGHSVPKWLANADNVRDTGKRLADQAGLPTEAETGSASLSLLVVGLVVAAGTALYFIGRRQGWW